MPVPALSFALAPRRRVKPLIKFVDRASFEQARIALGGGAAEIYKFEASEEHPDTPEREHVCHLGFKDTWNQVLQRISRQFTFAYMNGDCWHLALALNRLYGLPLLAIVIPRIHAGCMPDHPDPDMRTDSVSHVGACLPDGRILDIHGIHPDSMAFRRSVPDHADYPVRSIDRDEIIAILDAYAIQMEERPVVWDNPAEYRYAGVSEVLAQMLFGEIIRASLGNAHNSE